MSLVRIGYWRDDRTQGWPDVRRFVDLNWDASEREKVADHLRRGFVARAYLGKSRCRLCGEPVGSLELSDGVFIWPDGLVHYVETHGVRLPGRFVEHVGQWTDTIEGADVDEEWWRNQTELDLT
jgi:hypothetical protein